VTSRSVATRSPTPGPVTDLVTGLGTPDVDNLVRNVLVLQKATDEHRTRTERGGRADRRVPGVPDRRFPQASTADCAAATSPHGVGKAPTGCASRDFERRAGRPPATQPSLTSSLFPHLPPRSRTVFRSACGGARFAGRVRAAAVARRARHGSAALGLPFMFLLYLRESDAFRDIPTRTWALTRGAGPSGWVSDGCC